MDIINQIENDYGDFGDALIVNTEYFSGYNYNNKSFHEETLTIMISCFNIKKAYGESNELISLKFSGISYLNLKKYHGMIYQALLEKDNNNDYVIDFFPELIANKDQNGLTSKENYDSICIVKCKRIEFKLLAE